jgi:hypothetical protein
MPTTIRTSVPNQIGTSSLGIPASLEELSYSFHRLSKARRFNQAVMIGQRENPMNLCDRPIRQGSSFCDASRGLWIFNALGLGVRQDNERHRADSSNGHNKEKHALRPRNPKGGRHQRQNNAEQHHQD